MPFASDNFSANQADIIVVGGGLAGTAAACVLGRQGRRVTLVDSRAACPPVFKAEKIEPDQAALLRKSGLLELLLPRAAHIREVCACYNGRLFRLAPTEQYSMAYCDMVNSLREGLPETAEFRRARVAEIANSEEMQRVRLDSGDELRARLIVLACGLNAELPASLNLKRQTVQKHHSVAIAFNLEREDGQPFAFESATCYPASEANGSDYITLFPIGRTMRANFFAFPGRDGEWTRHFLKEPEGELRKCFPRLNRAIGEYRVSGSVETSLIHLYCTEGEPVPGVVLIGDAAQNVCPSTGMGLSKVFTDVDVLCSKCVPAWFATRGMGSEKTAEFWSDPQKRLVDAKALADARYRRQARTDRSWRWRIHRARLHFSMMIEDPKRPAKKIKSNAAM